MGDVFNKRIPQLPIFENRGISYSPQKEGLCWIEPCFGLLATRATPGVRERLKRRSGGDVLLGISLLRVVGVFAGAFELGHIMRVLRVR